MFLWAWKEITANEVSVSIDVPQDEDGFFTCRCPHCGDRFKLRADEFVEQSPDGLACAICGLSGPAGDFTITDEIRRVAMRHAENIATDLMNDFQGDLARQFKGGPVQFKRGKKLRPKPIPKLREFVDLADADLPCCDVHVRVPVAVATSTLYCPYCFNIQR